MLQKCCISAAEVQQKCSRYAAEVQQNSSREAAAQRQAAAKAAEQQQQCSNTGGNRQFLELISSLDGLTMDGNGRRPGGMRGAGLLVCISRISSISRNKQKDLTRHSPAGGGRIEAAERITAAPSQDFCRNWAGNWQASGRKLAGKSAGIQQSILVHCMNSKICVSLDTVVKI